jgi:hypothetical protein
MISLKVESYHPPQKKALNRLKAPYHFAETKKKLDI